MTHIFKEHVKIVKIYMNMRNFNVTIFTRFKIIHFI